MSCWTIRATCYIVVVSCITSKVDYFCNTKLQQRENRGNRLKGDQNIDSSSPARLVKELLCDISLRGSLLSSCNWNCRECFRLSTLLLTLIFHGSLAHLRLEIWPVWVNNQSTSLWKMDKSLNSRIHLLLSKFRGMKPFNEVHNGFSNPGGSCAWEMSIYHINTLTFTLLSKRMTR